MAERSSSISVLGEVAASPAGIHSSLSFHYPSISISHSSCLLYSYFILFHQSMSLRSIHSMYPSITYPSIYPSICSSTILLYIYLFFHHPILPYLYASFFPSSFYLSISPFSIKSSKYPSILSSTILEYIQLLFLPLSIIYPCVFFIHPSLSTSCLLPSILLLFYLFCLLFILFYRLPLSIILPYIHLSFLHLSFHHPSIYSPLLSPSLPLSVYPSFKHSVYLSYIHVFSFLPS